MSSVSVSSKGAWLYTIVAVFVVGALGLTACGPQTFVVGIEPTPTAVPSPVPILQSHANDEYGFSFHYPETWTLAEEPHLIRLSRDGLTLNIAYGWAPGLEMELGTGVAAGDFIYGGKVFFLDQVIPAQVLVFERKDKMVFYGGTDLVQVDDLAFRLWLEGSGGTYADIDIPDERQAEAQGILESFERIPGSGKPPAPIQEPTGVPVGDKDLLTYVSDDYGFALIYPPRWKLTEVPADGMAAAAIHLTRDDLRLAIQVKRDDEDLALGPGGRGAGEIEERGTATIFGTEVPMQGLVLDGRVKSVFVSAAIDDLMFYAQLDGGEEAQADYESIDISEAAQAEMATILSSLTTTGATSDAPASGLARYENARLGFTFQVPAGWQVEEVAGQVLEEKAGDGSAAPRLADAVVLRQGALAMVIQYMRTSDMGAVVWGGDGVPGGLGYAEAIAGDPLTLLGEQTQKLIWEVDGEVKAVAVSTSGESADLILSVTLADDSVRIIQDPEAEPIPESAMAALDQVLSSFEWSP